MSSIIQNLAKLATKVNSSGTISYADLGDTPEVLKITSVSYPNDDLAADPAGGQTITLTGSGFAAGATVLVDMSVASVVTVVNSTTITFIAPAKTAGSYIIYVINTDGSTALAIPGISYSGLPAWNTAAGNLGAEYETAAVSRSLSAIGDGTVTYSLISGTLPTGSTLNSSTGAITGTAPIVSGSTTYNFTIRATDAQNQDTDRAFSLTVTPDAVAWSSPSDNYTVVAEVDTATTLALSASSLTGNSVSYSANTLPLGMSISGSSITGTPTIVESFSTVITATAANTNKTANRTIAWVIQVGGDAYFKYVTLLLSGNGTNGANNNTFLDSSTNQLAITRYGNATQGSFSPYGDNWSTYFNGTSSITSTVTNAGTGSFTAECWVNFTVAPVSYAVIMKCSTSESWVNGWNIAADSSGRIGTYNGGGTTSGIQNVIAGKWYHLAVTRDSSNTLRFFIDGVLSGSASGVTTNYSSTLFSIGADSVSPLNYGMKGYISNARFITGTALYTSNFTPNANPLTEVSGTKVLTCRSNNFVDISSNAYPLTITGLPEIQRFNPLGTSATYNTSTFAGSGYFDGAGDCLSTSSATLALTSGNWTIEGWVYSSTASSGTYQCLYSNGYPVQIYLRNGNIECYASSSASSPSYFINGIGSNTPYVIKNNTWNHFAFVKNGTSYTAYVNGVAGTPIVSGSNPATPTEATYLAAYLANTYPMPGYLAGVRVVNGTAVYTTNFTPPTTPPTAITNTAFLCNFSNAAIYDSARMNTFETKGSSQISTSVKKYGTGSMSFSGSDYLYSLNTDAVKFGSSEFTIEFWMRPTLTNSAMVIFSTQSAGLWGPIGDIDIRTDYIGASSTPIHFSGGGADFWVTYNGALANNWTHFAACRSGSTVKIYINGVSIGSANATTQGTTQTSVINIGGGSGAAVSGYSMFTGYIDDLRITKGYARYTSNFTPPDAALAAK